MAAILFLLPAVSLRAASAQVVQDGPGAPSALTMTLPKSPVSLPAESWISSTAVDVHFQLEVTAGTVMPQVEIEPSAVPFTGQPNFSGTGLKSSGLASVSVTGLVNRQTYHWQARAADPAGKASQWIQFSSAKSAADVGVDQDPPSRPTIVSPTNPNQTRWYNTLVETLRWRATDALSGIKGYSFVVAQNANQSPPGSTTPDTSVRLVKLGDGAWFFAVRAEDKAGNWSSTATFRFRLDRHPATLSWLSPDRITFNPFRGPTTLRFKVSKNAGVTLQLYRVGAKQAIASFVFPHLKAGRVETFEWSGKDKRGKPFPSGYYFFAASAIDRAFNVTRANLGGIDYTPEQPHLSATGQVLYASDGKRIFVSLSRQTLYAYEGTKLLLQTFVTTGNPNLPTPLGHFAVIGKYHPYEFVSPWPLGSVYWYPPSWSQFAMLFKEGGYFLHDAPWRGAFGPGTDGAGQPGTNYGGTHGCINIPSPPMTFLYGWAQVGTVVDVVP
jgi:lipoprotein-anchoring transpeptidase ErfK/SrfK